MKTILFRMKEEIINGINYRLNGWTKTAEVIKKSEGYKGDVIIPETVVFNERNYRVTSIGKGAFLGCFSLTAITIPNSITSIGKKAFFDCSSLKEIIIGNSVKRIGRRAFLFCDSLVSITIPTSVKSIGWQAFDYCDSLLSFTFQGSLEQWKKIKLGYSWKTLLPTAVLHCTDGDLKV